MVNINRYLAVDADVSDVSTVNVPFFFAAEHEIHSNIDAKVTARFHHLGAFGLIGLGIVNRPIEVLGGPACTAAVSNSFCFTLDRETVTGTSIGSGVEVLQQRRVGLRFDFHMVFIPAEETQIPVPSFGPENRWQVNLGVMFHLW